MLFTLSGEQFCQFIDFSLESLNKVIYFNLFCYLNSRDIPDDLPSVPNSPSVHNFRPSARGFPSWPEAFDS
jgi:hypothetical protein